MVSVTGICMYNLLVLEMHAKTEHPAHADIPTRFRDTSCSDNSETGGCVVPPCPSDHRDVRLFLFIAMDPEESEAVTGAIAGKGGLHGHHVAAVIWQTCDEDALQPPFQRQPEFFPAVDLLVDDGHRARPERAWARQGAQPAAGVANRALAAEHRVASRERKRGSGSVQGDRLVRAVRNGRRTVTRRAAAGHRLCYR
jgi:hypothetical protein